MNRLLSLTVVAGLGSTSLACIEKDAADPGEFVRAETSRVLMRSPSPSTVRCRCDAEGGLHVHAPEGSQFTRIANDADDAEAEVTLASEAPPPPRLRQSKSLGFIGDNKLGESRIRGGPWAAPDALLPAHRHVEPRYGPSYGYGYRTYGYRFRPGWR